MNKLHVVIVIPTYNERKNILNLLTSIQKQKKLIPTAEISILIVDDSSPDGTAEIARNYARKLPNVHILDKGKKQGLGAAYIRGFAYAIHRLSADVIFEMDADLSHDPSDIPRFIKKIQHGSDMVIGSRYIEGGSLPHNWAFLRILNSACGNFIARFVAGLSTIKDCTSGYRAIRVEILRNIRMDRLNVKGYAFQISLLFHVMKSGAKVTEIPIHFSDRSHGSSKLRIADVVEFLSTSINLGIQSIPSLLTATLLTIAVVLLSAITLTPKFSLHLTISIITTLLTAQGLFTLAWMLYAWEDPGSIKKRKSPTQFTPPSHSFTALVPARHEKHVIKHTIRALEKIQYPTHLKEALILCRADDTSTIQAVKDELEKRKTHNIKLEIFDGFPINKSRALNHGLQHASGNIITIFDAEDEPHPDIYNVINTSLKKQRADVIQSGVQLMNYQTHWFSALNVMEYFLWFKSGLHFFLRFGHVTPLGGNSVFFKAELLRNIDGWDEQCLTEDADIGIRLVLSGAKMSIIYDELHATQEETPSTVSDFIKQRTRWNQGFMQIILKNDWMKLPTLRQRFMTLYVLTSPVFQVFLLLYIPGAIMIALTQEIPILITMYAFVPLYIYILQILVYVIGLYEFTVAYKRPFPIWMPFKLIFTYYPFQLLLMISAFRAAYRILQSNNNWEKTAHYNIHRKSVSPAFSKHT